MGKDQELLEACRTGNVAAIEKLLAGRLGAKGRGSKAGGGGGALSTLSKSLWNLKSANVNCVDASGDTPLHLAALNGHKEIVTMLLECDATPASLDNQDCSPLHLAAWSGHTDICSHLVHSPEGEGLINLQTRDGNTALHFAAQHGHNKTLSLLLLKKADPSIRNLEDLSPLDLAAQYDRIDIVKQLVTSHPELVSQRSMLHTPLHLASRNGHRAVVEHLLDSGFPIDAKTDKGSALHEAANFCKLDVIKLLLERGIDISIKSQTKCSAEDILRSIPSKTAEDALSILKAHIFHQRTPDSDGEKGIVGEGESCPPDTPSATAQIVSTSSPKPSGPVASERKALLHRSLPGGTDELAPPPLPPRQSVRARDSSESLDSPGLNPLKMTWDKGSDREPSSDEDKNKLSASPRDTSPCTRSPSELPKKPPRKKPLSFRKADQGGPIRDVSSKGDRDKSETTAPEGNKSYVNLDPQRERALIDAAISSQPPADLQGPQLVVPTDVLSQALPSNNESLEQQMKSGETTENVIEKACEQEALKPPVVEVLEEAICDSQNNRSEQGSKPPSTLDFEVSEIQQQQQHLPSSPSHPRQPPTPDCPPPSPGTALQNIQRKIQPMEKRKSRDMETTTDVLLANPDHPPLAPAGACDPQQATLTPVTEEPVVGVAGGQPLHGGQRPKTKPKPLPRKSSLTSETKDLPPTVSVADETVASSQSTIETPSGLEGYYGGQPMSKSKPLLKQSQVGTGDSELEESRDVSGAGAGVGGGGGGGEGGEGGGGEMGAGGATKQESNSPQLFRNTSSVPNDRSKGEEEQVQMRRSMSAGSEPIDWEGHVFADLFRGSVVGGPRAVSCQLGGNNVSAAALRKKRKSTASTFVTFAPVMEEDKDIDTDKLMSEIDNIGTSRVGRTSASDEVFDDDSEEWDKIAEIISSYGGRISSSGDYALFEAHIDQLLAGKGEYKIQSVGEWLASIGLPQYENTLVANGFDDTDFLGENILEDQDLIAIGVASLPHRQTILTAARQLTQQPPIDLAKLPDSVAEWLGSLRLDHYLDTFISHTYDTMERVVKLWELELVTVFDITSIGHRKRILASLGERQPEVASPARSKLTNLEDLVQPKSPFDHIDLYRDYSGVRSRVSDPDQEQDVGQRSLMTFENSEQGDPVKGQRIRDSSIHIRAPHLMHYTGAIKQWRHKPEILIKGCCNYTAHYLGSTLVKELKGAISTQEGIAKLKKSSEVISKIPTIMLSISFKGVKFIDAASKKVVCDHEIANIFCACQDGEHMNFFAYITKDREVGRHYCHVFSVRSKELAGEIILTLGEAFEIAYQMALKERAEEAADEFEKLSMSDDNTSVSSKASVNTV